MTIIINTRTWCAIKLMKNIRNASTIYALSSGSGKCGVAVIRVSGNNAGDALKTITNLNTLPKPRLALLKNLYHPTSQEILDKGLVLWFPGPKSFTGEDCCEFQVHGGLAVITSVLNALNTFPNLRPAEPGEFTRRAFFNGKLDLTEVEGLADLLQAETEMQRKQALLQTNGSLGTLYNTWRQTLLKSVANIEACIDFEESESLDESDLLNNTIKLVQSLNSELQKHLEDGRKGEILRNGIKTVIIGEPNAGKSSLFNMLCQKPAAIVSPTAGTTRDLVQITLDINGYPLVLTDTAGLRQTTTDLIEKEGIHRALQSAESADFVILVADAQKYLNSKLTTTEFINYYCTNLGINQNLLNYVLVLNKSDLISLKTENELFDKDNIVLLSCVTKYGLDSLVTKLTANFQKLCGEPNREHPCMSRQRHRHALRACSMYLERFLRAKDNSATDVVLIAQNLRLALKHLAGITGIVTTEQLLDVIFKDFCIGK